MTSEVENTIITPKKLRNSEILKGSLIHTHLFGKIVREFGNFVFKNEEIQRIFDSILCVPIDLQDCNGSIWHGVTNTLSQAISSFNPTWMEEDDPSIDSCSDICFMEAVEIAEKIIHRYIKRAEAIYESERIVSEALKAKEPDSHYIILERYVNYITRI